MSNFFITTSWDDGSKHDLKLALLLAKYEIPATFYIAHEGIRGDILYPSHIRRLSEQFEIGSHTLNHLYLTKVSSQKAQEEIIEGKQALEDLTGKEIISFSYPWGAYNSQIKQMVGLSGFKFARTTKAFAISILDRLTVPITIHAYDDDISHFLVHGHKILLRKLFYYSLLKRGLDFKWDNLALLILDYCLENGGIFHLYGHSWEIEKKNYWRRLENVLKYMKSNSNESQRVTNGELSLRIEKVKKNYYCDSNAEQFEKGYLTPYYKKELNVLNNVVKDFDKKGNEILDMGCGTGRVSSLFTKANYTGIDYSKGFIDFAKKKYHATNRKFINSDCWENKKLKSGKYDLIILWGFIDNAINPLTVIGDLRPLIKKGTRIVFTLHNTKNPFYQAIKYIRNEYFNQPYSLTSFDAKELSPYIMKFCQENKLKYQITSLGLINPSNKFIPYIPFGAKGNTLVYIFDKV